MTFQTEFPDYPAADMPVMPSGFEDSSWRNDASPCFINVALRLCVFVDYLDATSREFFDADRFIVMPMDENGCHTGEDCLLSTDDWSEVLAFVAARAVVLS